MALIALSGWNDILEKPASEPNWALNNELEVAYPTTKWSLGTYFGMFYWIRNPKGEIMQTPSLNDSFLLAIEIMQEECCSQRIQAWVRILLYCLAATGDWNSWGKKLSCKLGFYVLQKRRSLHLSILYFSTPVHIEMMCSGDWTSKTAPSFICFTLKLCEPTHPLTRNTN